MSFESGFFGFEGAFAERFRDAHSRILPMLWPSVGIRFDPNRHLLRPVSQMRLVRNNFEIDSAKNFLA